MSYGPCRCSLKNKTKFLLSQVREKILKRRRVRKVIRSYRRNGKTWGLRYLELYFVDLVFYFTDQMNTRSNFINGRLNGKKLFTFRYFLTDETEVSVISSSILLTNGRTLDEISTSYCSLCRSHLLRLSRRPLDCDRDGQSSLFYRRTRTYTVGPLIHSVIVSQKYCSVILS